MKVDKNIMINLSEEELQSICNTIDCMKNLLKVIEQEPDLNANFELIRGNDDVDELLSICNRLTDYF